MRAVLDSQLKGEEPMGMRADKPSIHMSSALPLVHAMGRWLEKWVHAGNMSTVMWERESS